MTYEEYLKLKKDIELEYRRNLDALELTWKRYKSISGQTRESNDPDSPSSEKLSTAVRIVVNGINQNFSVDDIERGLKDHGLFEGKQIKRLALTNTLHRLARREELEVIKKGKGRLPGIYRKKILSQ